MSERGESRHSTCQGCQEPPLFDAALCDGCGLCLEACPCRAIAMGPHGLEFACGTRCDDRETCVALSFGFFPCESACPRGAIQARFAIVPGGQADEGPGVSTP